MALTRALATVREAPFIVDVLHAADDLALEATRNGGRRAADLLTEAIEDADDELTAIAAVHALGRVFDDQADAVLSRLLSHERAFLREHASWALGSRLPRLDAIGRLVAVVTGGGFSGMLAQRTLAQWARAAPDHVALALEGAIAVQQDSPARARLVETLGLVPGELAGGAVLRIASDPQEDDAIRTVAVGAIGDRAGHSDAIELVYRLLPAGGELGQAARLAALDLGILAAGHLPAPIRGASSSPHDGLSIVQLFLHADIDRELSRSGVGDNGGVATLLLRLGDALARDPRVNRVITLSRGSARSAAEELIDPAPDPQHDRHLLLPVPLFRPPGGISDAWPARVAAERGIRRALRAQGRVDVLHLRMADVGSLAADVVAQELGIPTVFTLAPDPHAMIHAMDMTGALSRAGFGTADEREHFWFRARLVQRLAATAAHNVLFPRPALQHDLRELLGVDVRQEPQRYTVVPEGIDLAVTEQARADVATGAAGRAVDELDELLAGLPAERRGLPLAVSVGRLNRVKGMATIVEAWSGDPGLRERCNLLIVGGDLEHPSGEERGQLDQIAQLAPPGSAVAEGLILAGHRPNDVVARWLAVAERGGHQAGPGGIYVCGSLKEEFGLAVVEALAAGLVVVAPDGGGPATYVEPGVTGLLVNTRLPAAVGAGMRAALDLAARPDAPRRAERARELIQSRFTVQAMATALAGIYADVSQPATRR